MIILMAFLLPEISFLLDLGGLELVYGFVILYCDNIKQRLIDIWGHIQSFLTAFLMIYQQSVINQKRSFFSQMLISTACLFFTCSLIITITQLISLLWIT